jgi:hypothetical protein
MDEIHDLDMQIEKSKKHLHSVNDEIASAKALLNSYHMLCERKRQESEHLNNNISRLETVISRFKDNNEEYLKIKKTVEDKVGSVLTDGKVVLQFALAVIIEALRRNLDKYNDLLIDNTSTSMPTQQSPSSYVGSYKDMILEEANRLHDRLFKYFINSIINNAAFNMMSLSSLLCNLSSQANQSDNTYRKEDSEIDHNSKALESWIFSFFQRCFQSCFLVTL